MPRVKDAVGGEIPSGSIVAYNPYTWGAGVAVFHSDGSGMSALPRFRTKFTPVPPGTADFSPNTGLVSGADYWGHTHANIQMAASLGDGTIYASCSGQTNVWLFNPGNGVNTNYVFSQDVVTLQGIVALPNGLVGMVGANRKIRFYRATYSGASIPVLGPVVKAVDLPGDAWICDATSFKDGTIGIMINYDQTDLENPPNVDVLERWAIDGEEPRYIETISLYGWAMGHPCGDAAVQGRTGTMFMVR